MEDASISSFGALSEVLADFAGLDPNVGGAFSLGNIESYKEVLATELGVNFTGKELRSCGSLDVLTRAVYGKLQVDASGNSIIDVFTQIELIAKSELHRSVHLRWFSDWREFDSSGNWLTKPDWLDYFEMFDRIREELGADLGVTTKSFERMPRTVGETVKRVWELRIANVSN